MPATYIINYYISFLNMLSSIYFLIEFTVFLIYFLKYFNPE